MLKGLGMDTDGKSLYRASNPFSVSHKNSITLGTRTRGDMNTGHAPTYENNLKNWKEKINE